VYDRIRPIVLRRKARATRIIAFAVGPMPEPEGIPGS
jgi:hypothetical protein